MFLTQKKEVKKDFIPGYTGHVPHKREYIASDLTCTKPGVPKKIHVAATSGRNGLIGTQPVTPHYDLKGGRHPGACSNIGMRTHSVGANLKANSLKYGNWSKKAPTWICGPTHEIRYQQIPGYTCHVPAVKAENLFAKSYARTTATANSNKRFNRNIGQKPNIKDRYITHNQNEFGAKNFRRYLDDPGLIEKKDYQDYATSLNREKYNHKNKILTETQPVTIGTL